MDIENLTDSELFTLRDKLEHEIARAGIQLRFKDMDKAIDKVFLVDDEMTEREERFQGKAD